VLDPATKKVLWLDPSVDSDDEPTWSPDGAHVALLRIPASSEPPSFVSRPIAEPWSIRLADARDGTGRELFRADPGSGSAFHPADAEAALWWAAGDRLAFPWEKGGWLHLWSIGIGGGKPVELTPGAFEIENVAMTVDRGAMLVSSNQSGLDQRQVWSVAVDGSAPARRVTTSTSAFEFDPAPLAAGAVAYLESGARQPTRPMRLAVASAAPAALRPGALPEDYPSAMLVEPANVVFPSTDGLAIHGQLFLPPGAASGPRHAAVVFVHGGPVRQMLAAFHYMDYYWQAYAVNQALASRGFVVLSVNYRSGIAYGLDFREAPGIGEAGGAEFQDVLAGALFLKSRSEVDGVRIGIWGGSYGGYLTALALARASNVFKAGVDFHGVHDWNLEFPNPPFTRDYLATADRLGTAFRASPLADVAGWRSPVLLIQGDDDHNVPFEQTVRLAEALRKQGVPFEQLVFPDEVHGFLLRSTWLRAYGATIAFLEDKLR
jgi:dipeptidyl aminopeptidase/acylaminoacyl peptidase